jgi:hypothetical protein
MAPREAGAGRSVSAAGEKRRPSAGRGKNRAISPPQPPSVTLATHVLKEARLLLSKSGRASAAFSKRNANDFSLWGTPDGTGPRLMRYRIASGSFTEEELSSSESPSHCGKARTR